MASAKIFTETTSSSTTANSSLPCIRLSVPGMVQPKATPFFISYMDDPHTARVKNYDALIATAEAVLDGTSDLLK